MQNSLVSSFVLLMTMRSLLTMLKGREFPPRRIVLPVDTNAVAGKDVVLPCHGNRVSSYSWTKNDVVLDANANPRITIRGGDLHIKSVTKSDAGEYVCTPSIAAKSKKTTATLAVYCMKNCLVRKSSV